MEITAEKPKRQLTGIGQGFTILGSILLAFAIDAAWQDWVDGRDTKELLAAFHQELDYNIERGKQSNAFFTAKNESSLRILELAAADDSSKVNSAELDRLINDLTWWGKSHFSTGALDAIIEGGLLREIEPLELRVAIAGWSRELEFLGQIELQDYETHQSQWLPFLHKNANLLQLTNVTAVRPGGNSDGWEKYSVPNRSPRDHREMLDDSEFLALVTNTLWNGKDGDQFSKIFVERAYELKSMLSAVRADDQSP